VVEWLEPWWSTEDQSDHFRETFLRQLRLELSPAHALFGLPARVIGRGDGDDALFEILDGTGRVAVVHLVWSKAQQEPPWPGTSIYPSLQAFVDVRMRPEHLEWVASQE
jgi:hypothetical protein